MSVTSAKSGATGISLALDNNYMEPIATTVVGSTAVNSITFNDIPQGYKHLQIRLLAFGTSGANVNLTINSDSGTNYSYHRLAGNGSAASADNVTSFTSAFLTDATFNGLEPTTYPNVSIIDILDYSNSNKNKTIRLLTGIDKNGVGGSVQLISNAWYSTSSIVSLKLFGNGGNFNQYSRFSLYGIKG